ncbi:MAG: hypothetical protein OXC60_07390 [Litoreibacter sp.]|nr:hypothetical protein [Litoreibacter sp.]
MSDISELENRITAALDRIAWSVENQPAATPSEVAATPAGDEDLVEELEVERATNARLVASREKHVARIERLETRVLRMSDRLQTAELENKRLEAVIAALTAQNDTLREANASGTDAGETINAGLVAQIDDLKAQRKQDLADLDDILAELDPLVKEA